MNPIRFWSTKQSSQASLDRIMNLLRQASARRVSVEYGTGQRVAAVHFQLDTQLGISTFALPINRAALKARIDSLWRTGTIRQRITDDDRIERIALRCVQEWLHCQVTLFATGMLTPEEAMFGSLLGDNGTRVFDQALEMAQLPVPTEDADAGVSHG